MPPNSHPAFEGLLLWQTGELAPAETEAMRKHLQACPECRKKLEELDALNAETEWASTRAAQRRMHIRVQERDRSRWNGVLTRLTRKLVLDRPWMTATASIVIVALILFTFTDLTPSARAEALLGKAIQQQNRVGFQPHMLRVQSGSTQCEVNMERAGAQRLLVSSEAGFCDSVSAQLHTLGWTWNDLLSAKRFEQWRASLKEKHDSIHKLAEVTEVSTSTEDGPIRKATLRLRTADYHPVAARFQFAAGLPQPEIEVAEEPVVAELPEVAVTPALPKPAPESTPVITPAINPLDQAEAEVRLALHRAGMDSDILLAVQPQGTGVRVWGVVSTGAQKDSIAQALAGIPNVTLAVLTDAEEQAALAPLPWQAMHGVAPPLASAQLESLFAGNPEGRQAFENDLDRVTLRLVGEAKTRDALLTLARRDPSAPYAAQLHEAASSLGVGMVAEQKLLRQRLQPVIGFPDSHVRLLTYAQAEQVYTLVHDVALSSSSDAPVLDEAKTRLRRLLQ